jgi:WD40 repeat protein/Tfp pilus assembly protein PilF
MTAATTISDTPAPVMPPPAMPPPAMPSPPPATSASAEIQNPFPGPQPYRAEDERLFSGREADAARLERHVLASACTTLFGPSGSGKSSLMQAAVAPSLVRKYGCRVMRCDSWPAGEAPLVWFVRELCRQVIGSAPQPLVDPIAAIDDVLARAAAAERPLLIYLDQLEQLLYAERKPAELIALLEGVDRVVQKPSHGLHVVLALREDYLGRFRDRARRYRLLLEHSFRLGPMTVKAMTEAVCKAAAKGKPPQTWSAEEVTELLLQVCASGQAAGDDAGERGPDLQVTADTEVHGALAQIVCRALWDARRVRGGSARLTAMKPDTILERHLATTLAGLGQHAKAARRLLEDKLIDERGHRLLLTEDSAAAALPAGAASSVLRALERAAVLHAERYDAGCFYELAHDILAQHVHDAQRRREQAAQRRRWRAVLGLAAIGTVVGIVAGVGWNSRRTQLQRSRAQEQLLTAAASLVQAEPVRSAQLALEIPHGENDDIAPEAEAALRTALRAIRFHGLVIASAGGFRDAKLLPDGKLVTIGAADGLALWDPATGSRLHAVHADPSLAVLAIARSEGRTLAATAGELGVIDLWDLDRLQRTATLRGHIDAVTAIAVDPVGSVLATASRDGSVRLWNAKTGNPWGRAPRLMHPCAVTAVAFTHDGERLATVDDDHRVVLWDARSGDKLGEFPEIPTESPQRRTARGRVQRDARGVAFNATGRLLAILGDREVMLLDPITHQLAAILLHETDVSSIAFSPDGDRIASIDVNGTIRIWNATTGAEQAQWTTEPSLREPDVAAGPSGAAAERFALSFSADGDSLVTTDRDGTAKLWASDDGGELASFRVHGGRIRAMAYDRRAGRLAVAGHDGAVDVRDALGHRVARLPPSAGAPYTTLAFDPAGTHLVTANASTAVVWNLAAGKPAPKDLRFSKPRLRGLVVYGEHDRVRIAVIAQASNGTWRLEVRDLESEQPLLSVPVPARAAVVAVSPDEQTLACECEVGEPTEHRLCLWSASSGQQVQVLESAPDSGQPSPVRQLAFSPDGRTLVSVGLDRQITRWDLAAGRLLSTVPDIRPGAVSAAFSPDGESLAVGGVDGVIRVYALSAEALVLAARSRPPFALPDSDCRRHVSRDCQEAATAAQLANRGRWLLRAGFDYPGHVLLALAHQRGAGDVTAEPARFGSAHRIGQAAAAVDATVVNELLSGVGHTNTIAIALRARRERAEALLHQAARIDPGLVIDPGELATRAIEWRVLDAARRLARQWHPEQIEPILALLPRLSSDPAQLRPLANAMAAAAVFAVVEDRLSNDDPAAALAALQEVAPHSESDASLVRRLTLKARAYLAIDRKPEAAQVAAEALAISRDPDALVALGALFERLDRAGDAERAYRGALKRDPAHTAALRALGTLLYLHNRFDDATVTLAQLSPQDPDYKQTAGFLGALLYDQHKPDEAYRWMAIAIDNRKPATLLNLAEAAWGTQRWLEARLIARRLLEARDAEPLSPDIALAMRFVIVASLAQACDPEAASELGALQELVASMQAAKDDDSGWSYQGSLEIASRISDPAQRHFVTALLAHVQSLGNTPSPEELRGLLRELDCPGVVWPGPSGPVRESPGRK